MTSAVAPSRSRRSCTEDPAVVERILDYGETLQSAAETVIKVDSGATIQNGGRLELISREISFGNGFAIPTGAGLDVDSADPTPP